MPHAADLLTVLLLIALEGLLSADNAMVLAVLVLGLPKHDRRKALHYGILGAFTFRTLATILALYLLGLGWVKLVGAAYLFYLAAAHFGQGGGVEGRRTPAKATPMLGLSAFWATVVKVEFTDFVFAMDSILVAVAMSSKLWVVLAGGILGIIMMRLVIGKLLSVVERYPLLVDAAFVIIGWVALKLLLEYLYSVGYIRFEIPKAFSLGVIVGVFLAAFLYARYQAKKIAPTGTSTLFFELPQGAPRAFVGRAWRRHRRSINSLEAAYFDFFGRRLRSPILVELARFGFRDVPLGDRANDEMLLASERATDLDLVAGADESIRFGGLTVDVDFAASARLLRLGPRFIQARHIEPDIEAYSGRCVVARFHRRRDASRQQRYIVIVDGKNQ